MDRLQARSTLPFALAAMVLPLAGVACGDGDGAESSSEAGVTVRDSAGIRIVESHDSAWTDATRWRLADRPDFVIGSLDGSVPGTDFGQRILPGLLGDRVLVLDTSNDDLRLFDENGVYLRTLSRRGQGPTELTGANRMATFGDSVATVWDAGGRKIVRFDLAGDSISSQATGEPPDAGPAGGLRIGGMSSWSVRDWFADESYIVTEGITMMSGRPMGLSVDSMEWHAISAAGEHIAKIGDFPSRTFWSDGDGSIGSAFFAVGGVTPMDSTVLQFFPSEGFEFSERRVDGSKKAIVRAAVRRRPVTEELVTALRESQEALMGPLIEDGPPQLREMRETTAELQRTAPYPDSIAPFSELLVTPSGHVLAELADPDWLTARRPDTPDQPRLYRWVVFDPDGRWLGTLAAPPGLEVTEIGENALVGVRRDEFDVPYVERWRIIKP